MCDKTAIFYFSIIPYNSLFARHQQLYGEWRSNFSEEHEFYYVNPPRRVVHFPKLLLHELEYSLKKLFSRHTTERDAHILTAWQHSIYFPYTLPSLGLAVPRQILENPRLLKLFRFFLRRLLDKRTNINQKMIAIVSSPFWAPLITRNMFDLICYDCVDDLEAVSTPDTYDLARSTHQELIMKSDLIFVTAEKLKEDVLSIAHNKDIMVVSNGVDAEFFESAKKPQVTMSYVKKSRKAVGYVGHFGWFDFDLIFATANLLTDVDFVFIGPVRGHANYIQNKPKNVFALGTKEYAQIPAYIDLLDVCLIPFRQGPIIEATDPIKLYEYFSLGKPVVATHLRPLERFNDGHLLKLAGTPDEFVAAIRFFLMHDTNAWQASRRQVALQNSWRSKASLIMSSIESHLNASKAETNTRNVSTSVDSR
jgi:glycosyltransferase involved in cell wall biosynthesis